MANKKFSDFSSGGQLLPSDIIVGLRSGVNTQFNNVNNVNSVFGRNVNVVAEAGDYDVSEVTGAAPLSSPSFTGTPTAPTQSSGDNSTKLATTAYVESAVSGSVSSITGTLNQVIVSSPTGNVTLSLPQSIAVNSSPGFSKLTLSSSAADALTVRNISGAIGVVNPDLSITTPATSATVNASSIIIQPAQGNSSNGGGITLQGGLAFGSGSPQGGPISIIAGSGLGPLGNGGSLTLGSGQSSGSNGGPINIVGGASANSNGSTINISAGSGGTTGGNVDIFSGNGPINGKITLNTGTVQLSSNPVSTSVSIITPVPSSGVNGQSINIQPAAGVSSNGGSLNFNAGASNGAGSQSSGSVLISSGTANSSTGNAGNLTLSGGGSSGGEGGSIFLNAGNGAVDSGSITLNAGATGVPGRINLKTGLVHVDTLTASQLVATDSNKNLISTLTSAIGLLNIQKFNTVGGATYTPTVGATKALVIMIGGGAGGGGSGSGITPGGNGGIGGTTNFGTITTNGGSGGIGGGALEGRGGAGGNVIVGSTLLSFNGGGGNSGLQGTGGNGADGLYGGSGRGGTPSAASPGEAGQSYGAGGGGGSRVSVSGAGGGGGAGSAAYLFLTSLTSTSVGVGIGGTGGTAGTSGAVGGTGLNGLILIFEYT